MRTLLIDNHDSYTYNLYQLIAEATGATPAVLVNDDARLAGLDPGAFDAAVISPGPGRPPRERDTGHLTAFLRRTELPVLGVCLGHQAIAHAAGAEVGLAPAPRHGHLTTVRRSGDDELLRGLPETFTAVRYHSLCVREPLPASLEVTARAEDDVIMALRHRTLPRWGVQFHPESVATRFGRELMENFAWLAGQRGLRGSGGLPGVPGPRETVRLGERQRPERAERPARPEGLAGPEGPEASGGAWGLTGRALRGRVDVEELFTELFGESAGSFWLDSSLVQPGLSRFSFMGDASGPLSETLTYRVGDGNVIVTDAHGIRTEPGSMFDVLERRLARRRLADDGIAGNGGIAGGAGFGAGSSGGFGGGGFGAGSGGLPFGFTGGYVGYFGYEMKADCGADAPHRSPTPDALWIFADRLLAVDHATGVTYVIAVHDGTGASRLAGREWVAETARRVESLAAPPSVEAGPLIETGAPVEAGALAETGAPGADGPEIGPDAADPRFLAAHLVRDADAYQRDIAECQRQLRLGESYEICLTNRLRLPFRDGDLAYYKRLRRVNPAPYAALLRAGDVTVFGSSPERFLRIDPGPGRQRRVESKPIKGTAPRHPDARRDAEIATRLASDPKTVAENLMIVDLLRNDLGRVCETGSVNVPRYMAVESYATMHQLVSTVTGRLLPSVSAVECVRRCFPGGSMTGAPKPRTMEIIDRLEPEARGVYSGALGYFGLGGAVDLSIVIRTAVRQGGTLTVGAGGAIVLGSDPGEEYEEMMLKAAASLRAYQPAASRDAESRDAESHDTESRGAVA